MEREIGVPPFTGTPPIIEKAVKNPDKMTKYSIDPDIRFYYSHHKNRKSKARYLRVVVKYLNGRLYYNSIFRQGDSMKGQMQIYYDEEGDFLEINIGEYTEGYFKDIGEGISERIDENTGKITGIAMAMRRLSQRRPS